MHIYLIIIKAVFALVAAFPVWSPPPPPVPVVAKVTPVVQPIPVVLNSEEQTVFDGINRERIAAGLRPYVLDDRMVDIARLRAGQIVAFGDAPQHTAPDGSLPYIGLLDRAGFVGKAKGENLGWEYTPNPERVGVAVMEGWMQSAPHRANVLDRQFTRIGVGSAGSGKEHWYALVFVSD